MRLSFNVDDFNRERLRIDVLLLLTSDPPEMISNAFLPIFLSA